MSEAAPAVPEAPPANPGAPVEEVKQETPAEQPEKTFTQKELDEILEKRLAKERRKREELKQEAAALRKLALERAERREEPEKPKPSTDGEPKREQFDSYEAYIEARAEWKADQAAERRFAKQQEEERARTAREEAQKQAEAFKKRTKELSKDLEDFDEVMAEATASPDSPVSRLFADPINECDNPAQVLYHLAKNPEEAERIASLGAAKQAREIWALEAKLKAAPAPKKPSAAPAPITPVGGTKGGPASELPTDADDIETWMKKERARARKS